MLKVCSKITEHHQMSDLANLEGQITLPIGLMFRKNVIDEIDLLLRRCRLGKKLNANKRGHQLPGRSSPEARTEGEEEEKSK